MNQLDIRKQILRDVELLDPSLLSQAYHYISLLKSSGSKQLNSWRSFIGCISDIDAKEHKKIIDNEFENIEGEW